MTFKSTDDIKRYINNKLPNAVEISMKEIWQIMDKGLGFFYSDYKPYVYDRTNQLRNSLVDAEIVATGNGAKGRVYYDAGRMSYSTGAKPSGEEVLNTAMAGGHGVYGLNVVQRSPVWSKVESEVTGSIDKIIKNALIASGVPVK